MCEPLHVRGYFFRFMAPRILPWIAAGSAGRMLGSKIVIQSKSISFWSTIPKSCRLSRQGHATTKNSKRRRDSIRGDVASVGRRSTMMNRRQFFCTAAASAAAVTYIPNALAATYDLIVKGGRVIDSSLGIDAVRDVAVAGGRIAAVEANIGSEGAPDIIDARGKIVVPGLVDIHTHA